ncbi:MAG: DUF4333 domain-containing protein [Aeromicrobium sp.]
MTTRATLGRAISFTAALTACLALSACGSTVDAADAEKQATEKIPELAGSDMAIDSVACPEDVEYAVGETFDCDYVVEDGSKGVVTFEIENDDKYSLAIATNASGHVADYLLNEDEALASVECEDPIEDGSECSFEDEEGDTGTMTITLTDDGGFESAAEYD